MSFPVNKTNAYYLFSVTIDESKLKAISLGNTFRVLLALLKTSISCHRIKMKAPLLCFLLRLQICKMRRYIHLVNQCSVFSILYYISKIIAIKFPKTVLKISTINIRWLVIGNDVKWCSCSQRTKMRILLAFHPCSARTTAESSRSCYSILDCAHYSNYKKLATIFYSYSCGMYKCIYRWSH